AKRLNSLQTQHEMISKNKLPQKQEQTGGPHGHHEAKWLLTIDCFSNTPSSEKDLLQDLPLYTFVDLYFSGDTGQGTLNVPWILGARWTASSAL
ncbi:mCG144643, partial [Mus musculus]